MLIAAALAVAAAASAPPGRPLTAAEQQLLDRADVGSCTWRQKPRPARPILARAVKPAARPASAPPAPAKRAKPRKRPAAVIPAPEAPVEYELDCGTPQPAPTYVERFFPTPAEAPPPALPPEPEPTTPAARCECFAEASSSSSSWVFTFGGPVSVVIGAPEIPAAPAAPVPEPGVWLLLAAGVVVLRIATKGRQ